MKLMIKKRSLLLLAGFLWCFAGFQIAKIGFESVSLQHLKYYCLISGAILIFFIFFRFIFSSMVKKHTQRIRSYELELQPFYRFFDKKGYLIMACMMTGGVLIRSLHLLPYEFIAFFYTGLGIALCLSGILFLKEWMTFPSYDKIAK